MKKIFGICAYSISIYHKAASFVFHRRVMIFFIVFSFAENRIGTGMKQLYDWIHEYLLLYIKETFR